jgi:hypothetical protein
VTKSEGQFEDGVKVDNHIGNQELDEPETGPSVNDSISDESRRLGIASPEQAVEGGYYKDHSASCVSYKENSDSVSGEGRPSDE